MNGYNFFSDLVAAFGGVNQALAFKTAYLDLERKVLEKVRGIEAEFGPFANVPQVVWVKTTRIVGYKIVDQEKYNQFTQVMNSLQKSIADANRNGGSAAVANGLMLSAFLGLAALADPESVMGQRPITETRMDPVYK